MAAEIASVGHRQAKRSERPAERVEDGHTRLWHREPAAFGPIIYNRRMLRAFRGQMPRVHPTAYVDESAQIIGNDGDAVSTGGAAASGVCPGWPDMGAFWTGCGIARTISGALCFVQ
jgi:hypothetical protein